jgi:hypothetical protein
MKFRSKKDTSQSIAIRKQNLSSWHAAVFFEKQLGKQAIGASEPLPNRDTIEADCRLVIKRTGKLFLVVPQKALERSNHARDRLGQVSVVAIDSSVRTFATGYAPTGPDTGLALEYGKADMDRIQRLCHYADQLVSDIAKTSKAKRSRKRRALWRLHERIRNLVAEVHWKLGSFP